MKPVPGLFEIEEKVRKKLEKRMAQKSLLELKEFLEPKSPRPLDIIFPKNRINIIAEIKKASPSEGDIAPLADPLEVAKDYINSGAAGLSILTEEDYFKGKIEFVSEIRVAFPEAFLLMKDFIIDEYQILEGLKADADSVLLIVAMLGPKRTKDLYSIAKIWGLEPLVEVHSEKDFGIALDIGATFIGVNNRDLKTMKIDLNISEKLAPLAPASSKLVCESGLKTGTELKHFRRLGFDVFLMGTHFMKDPHPGKSLAKVLKEANAT